MLTTTKLTDALDATGEPWSLWRAATGLFCVSRGIGRDDPASREFSYATIDGVLRLALASKRLPVIPLRPSLHHYSYESRGTGSRRFKLLYDGLICMQFDRKRKAVSEVTRRIMVQRAAIDAWIDEHAHYTDTHTEGVDFYWAKQ